MEWTTEKPTEEGFYWFQLGQSAWREMIVEIYTYDHELWVKIPHAPLPGTRLCMMNDKSRWAGPLIAPSYHPQRIERG